MKCILQLIKKCYSFVVLTYSVIVFRYSAIAQMDTVSVASDTIGGNGGNLNTAVSVKIKAGTLSKTVFKLEPHGYYMLTDTIKVPKQQHLTIVADEPGTTQETAPSQILWSTNAKGTNYINFDCYGSITLKNVQLLYATAAGSQTGTTLQIEDDSIATVNGTGEVAEFDGVLFDYSACPYNGSGAVGVMAKHFRGTFKNCYFRNCVDAHYRYYGRAVSFPYNTTGYHTDSLTFENCTFANMGYVLMQENTEYSDFVKFNHCTFLNVMTVTLESGWWRDLAVTNSIFVNSFMLGEEVGEWLTTLQIRGGTVTIDSISNFGFTVPFNESDRHILLSHCSCSYDPWLRNWFNNDDNPIYLDWKSWRTIGANDHIVLEPMLDSTTRVFFDSVSNGKKMFPYMNRSCLYDSTDPRFIVPPTDSSLLKTYLYMKWCTGADLNWSWNVTDDLSLTWPMNENLAYTNDTLLHAGMGGFPLGDLYHWFPVQYASWKEQASLEHLKISNYLNTGVDTVTTGIGKQIGVVANYELSQNYPNPFNPLTKINYQLPTSGSVTLKIYDVLGRETATLVNGVRQAGSYTAEWNAAKYSSGVYFCKLYANNVTVIKKLVLIK
jgi:hypothetical protein